MSRVLDPPELVEVEPVHTRNYRAMAAPQDDFRNRNLARMLLDRATGRSLLDIGCGYGLLLAAAREAGFETVGIEPDGRLVELSKVLFGELGALHTGFGSLAPQRSWDTVVLADVLEAAVDDQTLLEEAVRCVAPGGRLVLCAPAGSWLYGTRDRDMGYHRRYDPQPTARRVEALGLRVREVRRWNALFVLPYFLAYKVLRLHSEYDGLRGGNARGRPARAVAHAFDLWFRRVERYVDFGVGLSLLIVAERPGSDGPAKGLT